MKRKEEKRKRKKERKRKEKRKRKKKKKGKRREREGEGERRLSWSSAHKWEPVVCYRAGDMGWPGQTVNIHCTLLWKHA